MIEMGLLSIVLHSFEILPLARSATSTSPTSIRSITIQLHLAGLHLPHFGLFQRSPIILRVGLFPFMKRNVAIP